MTRASLIALLQCLAVTLVAQVPPEQQLRAARSLKCTFPTIASLDWKRDDATPRIQSQNFEFIVDGIDHKARTARLVGNLGAVDLILVEGIKVTTFVETTPSGNVNLTTVFAEVMSDGRFKAVHSRHVYLIGGALPSQAYGSCQIWG
jgi:hypothetical protein